MSFLFAKIVSKLKNVVVLFLLLSLVFTSLLTSVSPVFAATGINKQIGYQGVLRNSSGNAVPNASYDIVFKIYNVSSGGTPLWTGTYTASNGNPVATNNGFFHVLLGSGTGNTMTVDFSQDEYYLGMTVGSDSEMTPRQRIASVPQAFNADMLDGLDSTAFVTSTGTQTITGDKTFTSSSGLALNPYGIGTGNTTELRFAELAANGTNYTGFKSPDALAANVLYALPSADGANGQMLSTNGTGALSWANANAATSTQTFSNSGHATGADTISVNSNTRILTLQEFFTSSNSQYSFTGLTVGNTYLLQIKGQQPMSGASRQITFPGITNAPTINLQTGQTADIDLEFIATGATTGNLLRTADRTFLTFSASAGNPGNHVIPADIYTIQIIGALNTGGSVQSQNFSGLSIGKTYRLQLTTTGAVNGASYYNFPGITDGKGNVLAWSGQTGDGTLNRWATFVAVSGTTGVLLNASGADAQFESIINVSGTNQFINGGGNSAYGKTFALASGAQLTTITLGGGFTRSGSFKLRASSAGSAQFYPLTVANTALYRTDGVPISNATPGVTIPANAEAIVHIVSDGTTISRLVYIPLYRELAPTVHKTAAGVNDMAASDENMLIHAESGVTALRFVAGNHTTDGAKFTIINHSGGNLNITVDNAWAGAFSNTEGTSVAANTAGTVTTLADLQQVEVSITISSGSKYLNVAKIGGGSSSNAFINNGNAFAGLATLGTTDNNALRIIASSTEAMRILTNGNVGIGTTAPGSALDVKGTLRLSGSTSGYVGFAPASAAGSTTYTLPSADGASGQMLSTNGSGALSWATGTGGVEGYTNQAVISNTTLTSWGIIVNVDASAGAVTITLPASSGNTNKAIRFYRVDSSTNTVIVQRAGSEVFQQAGAVGVSMLILKSGQGQITDVRSNGSNPEIINGSGIASIQRLWLPSDAAVAPTLWFKPDALLTAGALATWADSSGNANTATTVGSIGVTLNSLNGYSQVDFTAGQLNTTNAITTNSGSSFAVIKQPAAAIASSNTIWGGSSTNNMGFIVGGSVATFTLATLQENTAWGPNSTSAMTASAWGLAGITWNSSTANFYVEGKTVETAAWANGLTATETVMLGAHNVSGNRRTAPMAEVIIYGGTVLSQSDMDKLAGYAAYKYGLQANLQTGQTYKTNPPVISQVYSPISVTATNVGIGTSAPTAQLHTTGTVRFQNFGAGTLTTDANGNVTVSSDVRLKDVQSGFTRGLADLKGLTPISYNWTEASGLDTKNTYTGFAAQNVLEFIPEAVSESNGLLTLSDRPILAAAVNAIKELDNKVSVQGLQIGKVAGLVGVTQEDLDAIRDQYLSGVKAEQDARFAQLEAQWMALREDYQKKIASNSAESTSPANTTTDSANSLNLAEKSLNELEKKGAISYYENITVHGESIFEKLTTFIGDVLFKGRIVFEDKDVAGEAEILAGDTQVTITFDRSYTVKPLVNITIVDAQGYTNGFTVSDVTEKGFTIKLTKAYDKDILFNWAAVAVKDAKRYKSVGKNPTPTATLVPEPSMIPTDNIQPEPSPTPTATLEATPSSSPVEPTPTTIPTIKVSE